MVTRICRVLLVVVAVAGCGFAQGKQEGEAVAERYFVAAQKDDSATVLAMYDDAFNHATPNWRDTYARIRRKLGKPMSDTLTNWNVMKRTGFVGGHIRREDVAHGTTVEVLARTA